MRATLREHPSSKTSREPGAVTPADTDCFQQQYWRVSALQPRQSELCTVLGLISLPESDAWERAVTSLEHTESRPSDDE